MSAACTQIQIYFPRERETKSKTFANALDGVYVRLWSIIASVPTLVNRGLKLADVGSAANQILFCNEPGKKTSKIKKK